MKNWIALASLMSAMALGAVATAAEEPATELRSRGLQALAEKRYDDAERLFEEAVTTWMAQGKTARAASGLVDLGNVFEARGELEEAAVNYRSALGLHVEHGADSDVAIDLLNLAHVARRRGDVTQADEYVRLADEVLKGKKPKSALLAADLPPMNCSDSREITPNAADIPNGKWRMIAAGANQADAVANALDSLFANIYMPTCIPTCYPLQTCDPSVAVKRPVSTTPADYGSPQWQVLVRNGRTILRTVVITKFPAGMTVVQSCSMAVCAVDAK